MQQSEALQENEAMQSLEEAHDRAQKELFQRACFTSRTWRLVAARCEDGFARLACGLLQRCVCVTSRESPREPRVGRWIRPLGLRALPTLRLSQGLLPTQIVKSMFCSEHV